MQNVDDLADALFEKVDLPPADEWRCFTANELRALASASAAVGAREALQAVKEHYAPGRDWDTQVMYRDPFWEWLAAAYTMDEEQTDER